MDSFKKPKNYWFSSPEKHSFVTADHLLSNWLQDEFKKTYRKCSVISGFHNLTEENELNAQIYFLNFSEDELEHISNIYLFADESFFFASTKKAKEHLSEFISTYKTQLLRSLLVQQTPLGFAAFSDYVDEQWIPKSPVSGKLWTEERYNLVIDDAMDLYMHTDRICAQEFIEDLHSYRTGWLDETCLEDKIILFAKEFTNQHDASHPKEREFIYSSRRQ